MKLRATVWEFSSLSVMCVPSFLAPSLVSFALDDLPPVWTLLWRTGSPCACFTLLGGVLRILYSRGWRTSFVKGYTVNILEFEDHTVRVANAINLHCSWICIYEFAYSRSYICNCNINTYGAFVVVHGHVQSHEKWGSPNAYAHSCEVEQDDILASCFSSHTVYKCPFRDLLSVTVLCVFVTLLFKMAPK